MVDATPDVSHTEQSSFVIRYVHEKEPGKFLIEERFLIFADCAKKTGSDIADPQRWEILQKRLHGVSLHRQSGTRWTERLDSIRPFYNHLSQIIESLKEVKSLNITPKAKTEIRGALKYMSSFKCVLMSGIWLKVLTLIDRCNQVIQARKATIDIGVENIEALISQLKSVREEWPTVLEEAKLVADVAKISSEFPIYRKVKRKIFFGEQIKAIQEILSIFSFLWKYQKLSEAEIKSVCSHILQKYSCDVTENELAEVLLHIKQIHTANFGKEPLAPFDLLNKISEKKLGELFRNIVIALRIFASIPVTVASSERSFSEYVKYEEEVLLEAINSVISSPKMFLNEFGNKQSMVHAGYLPENMDILLRRANYLINGGDY
ncbi:uncharacterized protein LOC136083124 [Hydra vulgaris]|uniref:Uncharacterized protein LOC136083124 n=1 Tax=Hydra vulgaris TaxID=6087 RepID=A0ABM4CAB4_HYDVU